MCGREGQGYCAGTGRTADHPKRVMPKLHRHQATRAAGSKHLPIGCFPTASHGSNRPGVKMPLESVPEE